MSTEDHAVIYLEPGEGDGDTGRQWCQDDVWSGEDGYGDAANATKYIRADIVAGLIGLVELLIPTLEGSQKSAVMHNHRLIDARAAVGATP